ncbi:MAG TPA: hypothetical protein VFH43_10415 [Candidatus Kapabacteria bacterium]|nr:hypothetical protein [Candidatus Kapabacteria bacterium]
MSRSSIQESQALIKRLAMTQIALLAIFSVPLFVPMPSAWGFNLAQHIPQSWAFALLGIALAYCAWMWYAPITEQSAKPAQVKKAKGNSKTAPPKAVVPHAEAPKDLWPIRHPTPVALGFAVLFWLTPFAWSLLGDAGLFVGYNYRYVEHGEFIWSEREPLSAIILQIASKLVSLVKDPWDSMLPFRMVGVLCGFAWVLLSVKTAKLLSEDRQLRLLCFMLLMTCGGTLFFHGYIETYAQSYTASFFVCYLGLKLIKQGGSPISAIVWLLIATALHLQNVLLLPPLAFAIAHAKGYKLKVTRNMVIGTSVALCLIYVGAQFAQIYPLDSADNPFMPLSAVNEVKYTLFDAQHLFDILNEHLVLAPVVFAGLFAFASRKHRFSLQDPLIQFTLIALFFFEALMIGGFMTFGMARDWDVSALIGPLLVILFVLALDRREDSPAIRGRILRLVIPMAVLFQAGWLYTNLDLQTSIKKYVQVLDTYEPLIKKRNTHYGYENLRKILRYMQPGDEIYAIRKMTQLQPWPVTAIRAIEIAQNDGASLTPVAARQLHLFIQDLFSIKSDSILTMEEVAEDNLRAQVKHSASPSSLADIAVSLLGYEVSVTKRIPIPTADSILVSFAQAHPRLPQPYEMMAIFEINLNRNDFEKIKQLSLKALTLDSMRPRAHMTHSVALAGLGDLVSAKHAAQKALTLDPVWTDCWSYYMNLLDQFEPGRLAQSDLAILTRGLEQMMADKDADKDSLEKARQIKQRLEKLALRLASVNATGGK